MRTWIIIYCSNLRVLKRKWIYPTWNLLV